MGEGKDTQKPRRAGIWRVWKGLTECQLLEGTVRSLGEEEPNKDDFKCQPAAVCDQPLPANVVEANGIDERGEEIGHASKELEQSKSAGSLCVRPYFDHVRIGQGIVTEIVGRRID